MPQRYWSNFTVAQWASFTVDEWSTFLIDPISGENITDVFAPCGGQVLSISRDKENAYQPLSNATLKAPDACGYLFSPLVSNRLSEPSSEALIFKAYAELSASDLERQQDAIKPRAEKDAPNKTNNEVK